MEIYNQLAYNTNFKRLITGDGAKNKLCSKDCPKNIANKFISYRKVILKSKINKLDNIDIIIDYNNNYYLTVRPKNIESERPHNAHFPNIANSKECIQLLKKWGDYWNKYFAS